MPGLLRRELRDEELRIGVELAAGGLVLEARVTREAITEQLLDRLVHPPLQIGGGEVADARLAPEDVKVLLDGARLIEHPDLRPLQTVRGVQRAAEALLV